MTKKLFISDRHSDFKEYVRLTQSGIFFSAPFIKSNNLTRHNSVRFYEFTENQYKFGMEFFLETDVPGGFSLVRNGKSVNSFYTTARSFTNSFDVLRDLIKSKGHNRFAVSYDKIDKCFFFMVAPCFECDNDQLSIPDGATGIYRYKNTNNEIIYIGKGNIRDRLRSPERKGWDIKKVEYSLVNDRGEMSKYESYHLTEYQNKFNKWPEHNMISA